MEPVYEKWSAKSRQVPDSIDRQLVGTFPSIVLDESKGKRMPAFFIRAPQEEEFPFNENIACKVKPQLIKTPYGPIIVIYGMLGNDSGPPFISETAIFPRLDSMPSHIEIADLLLSESAVYYVVCDGAGLCMFNSRASIMRAWRKDIVQKSKMFDEGKQIADEKTALSSLFWYQDRYKATIEMFK